MSGPRRGEIVVKVLTGRTAAALQRYRESKEEGTEPALFVATRHCSSDVETQIAQWKAVRIEHGTDGAKRAPRATYETVDPETGLHASGQRGTHVKHFDGRRYRKRLAGANETPTHLRIEPDGITAEVKQAEAVHTIMGLGADLVHPEDHEALERVFLAVKAQRKERYPGIQETLWLERNGESGLAHIHIASNATIYRDFELDGVHYRAGQKMAGALTGVDEVRAEFERWLDAHPEHGFEQSLARVGTPEYEAAQRRDGQHAYWEKERAAREGRAPKETNQERIRREAYEALQEPGVTDRDAFVAEMKARGIAVDETGVRRGKRGKGYDLRYRVDGAKQGVKGRTLGPEYAHDAIDAQLARKAQGMEMELPVGPQRVGEPAQVPLTAERLTAEEQEELARLKVDVAALAQDERRLQGIDYQSEPTATSSLTDQRAELERRAAEAVDGQQARIEQLQQQMAADGQKGLEEARRLRAETDRFLALTGDAQDHSTVPERFAGLGEDELDARVDELVLVRMERLGSGWDRSRSDDLDAMCQRHGLSYDEADHIARAWWDRGRPEVASERVPALEEQQPPVPTIDEPEATSAEAEPIAPATTEPSFDELLAEAAPAIDAARAKEEFERLLAEADAQTPEASTSRVDAAFEPISDQEPQATFKSPLRQVVEDSKRMSDHKRTQLEGLAALDEEYLDRETDAEFERRLNEAGGVGAQTIRSYGEHFSDGMLTVLRTRVAQKADANEARQRDAKLSAEVSDLESKNRLTAQELDRLNAARAEAGFERRYRSTVETDIAEGRYELRDHDRERGDWARERLSEQVAALDHEDPDQPTAGRAPEQALTPAQQRVREIKARQKDAAKTRKERGQDQSHGMGM